MNNSTYFASEAVNEFYNSTASGNFKEITGAINGAIKTAAQAGEASVDVTINSNESDYLITYYKNLGYRLKYLSEDTDLGTTTYTIRWL